MRQLPMLNPLRVFEEVARHLSFSQAAASLNVTQGAVSRQIKQLEDYLGVALFVRGPRGLSLTESGSALSPHPGPRPAPPRPADLGHALALRAFAGVLPALSGYQPERDQPGRPRQPG